MSRVYEALRQMEKEHGASGTSSFRGLEELPGDVSSQQAELASAGSLSWKVLPASRLVALTEPRSLGAEKFRALVTRLENMRRQKEFKSLQITSSVVNEGKSLVAANLAITFAKHTRSKVLLLEGDLHRPSLTELFGLANLKGLIHWWSGETENIPQFLGQLNDMPLWLLSAGGTHEHPSHIIQSTRFNEMFNQLSGWFDWIVVDSTPMFPVSDVNLWSRLVDGTLLVVREGVAPVKAVKRGLQSLDKPNFVGVVMNEASEVDQAGYEGKYYASQKR